MELIIKKAENFIVNLYMKISAYKKLHVSRKFHHELVYEIFSIMHLKQKLFLVPSFTNLTRRSCYQKKK